MARRGLVVLYLVLWTLDGVVAYEIPRAAGEAAFVPAAAADGKAGNNIDGFEFDPASVLLSVSDTFRHVLSQINNNTEDEAYESQCLADFSTLFKLKDNNTVFHASKGTQAVDALGKPGPNLLYGNLHFVGSFDECMDIGEGYTQFCVTSMNITLTFDPNITLLPFSLDICVPQSCNVTDLFYFIYEANTYLHTHIPLFELFEIVLVNPDGIVCEDSRSIPYNTGAIIMITVCVIFLLLAIIGSVVDFGIRSLREVLSKPELSFIFKRNAYNTEDVPLLGSPQNRQLKDMFSQFEKPLQFITAFSTFKNVSMILSTKQPPTAITSLNGIRVISMFWVIVGHTYFWAIITNALTNPLYVYSHVLERFSFQAISNAFFSVDSFFFLSGALVAYLTLREMERKGGRFPVITYFLHRYLRLTMVYAFLLFFWWTLTVHLGNGAGWRAGVGEGSDGYEYCNKYWWTNFLYINNLYPWDMNNECMGWTWYLANDMQFYLLAPFILIPLYYIFPVGLAISGSLILVTFAANGAIAGKYDFSANTLLDASQQQSNDIYVKPYTRAAPYIVGLVVGFLLFRKVKINLHWFVDWLVYCAMWVVAAGCCFSVVYGLYSSWHGHEFSRFENVVYFMFSRFTWSIGLALVVFACHNGYGWVINDFLSMKMWIPLSRLTYSAYLIHPILLTVIFGTNRTPFQYTDYTLAVYAVATVVLSFGAAGVVAVFVEFPLSNLEMAVFGALGLKRRESTRHVSISENGVSPSHTPLPSTPINQDVK